jgi:hypothetical protein
MPSQTTAGAVQVLRSRLLEGAPASYGVEPVGPVWGVLMETGYPQAAATLVALGDGTASLYFSSGGGVVGGGAQPAIAGKARALVALAASQFTRLPHAPDFPLPAVGEVRFYVLTTGGVLGASAPHDALATGSHALSPLFLAGHEVLTGLREASEAREAQPRG